MASVQIEKKDLSPRLLPTWFQPVPGFKFRNGGGDPHIVIGWGGWRDTEVIVHESPFGQLIGNQLKFKPCGLLCAWLYKGEWHMEAVTDKWRWEIFKPGWTETQEKELGGWQ